MYVWVPAINPTDALLTTENSKYPQKIKNLLLN